MASCQANTKWLIAIWRHRDPQNGRYLQLWTRTLTFVLNADSLNVADLLNWAPVLEELDEPVAS